MSQATVWVDGKRTDRLPLPDRGLWFGDGLFETLLAHQGRPLLPALHLQRLQQGLQRLAFPDCLSSLDNQLRAACQAAGAGFQRVRLTVTRGGGPAGYAPPEGAAVRCVVTTQSLERDPRLPLPPAELELAGFRWGSQPLLAGLKHLNRLEQVLAAREIRARGCDELVVLGQGGAVVSAVAANLFVVCRNQLLTPVLVDAGIAGTRRRLILESLAERCGLRAGESPLTAADLLAADELLICNAVIGIRAVARLESRRWTAHPVARVLQDAYVGSLLS